MSLDRRIAQLKWAGSILRERGVGSVLRSAIDRVRSKLGFPSAAERGYLEARARVDASFDEGIGVDTGGTQLLSTLTIDSPNRKLGVTHIASNPGDFDVAMAGLRMDPKGATFIDYGAGKGRALLMAAAFPFRAIIGIEFARELWEIGTANLAKAAGQVPDADRLQLILADATQYDLPAGPITLYLYNPFEAPIIDAVARKALASWQADPRPMEAVYVNPVHLETWLKAGWHVIDRGEHHAILAPTG